MTSFIDDTPVLIKVSFHKIIEWYKQTLNQDRNEISRIYKQNILDYILEFPELSQGVENAEDLLKYKEPISVLLEDLFPDVLTNNDIKGAIIPFNHYIFYTTRRFRSILNEAGHNFKLSIKEVDQDQYFLMSCILILNEYYNCEIDNLRPYYFEIPDDEGITRYYRIGYNFDFIDIEKTESTLDLTEEDIDLLIQSFDDIDVWKEKFPPGSWCFRGFGIIDLTDVTIDTTISELKSSLLDQNVDDTASENFTRIFQRLFNMSNLEVGYSIYDKEVNTMHSIYNHSKNSFLLDTMGETDCTELFCQSSFQTLILEKEYFTISNVGRFVRKTPDALMSKNLQKHNIQSCILAPIAYQGELLGILELVSPHKNQLNSVVASKLDSIMPYIALAVRRNLSEFENRIKAVIQSECTSIHTSVLWKFEEEARRFIALNEDDDADTQLGFRDISFENVHPLYGQIDIISSSTIRNTAIQQDLLTQLHLIENILKETKKIEEIPIYEQLKYRTEKFEKSLKDKLSANSEERIFNFINKEINPLMVHIQRQSKELKNMVLDYQKRTDKNGGLIYEKRKEFDQAVMMTNKRLASFLDRKQEQIQKTYPHYYERFKTDGVEHNLYIGETIAKSKPFNRLYLKNLRLWQLITMCEMENYFYRLQGNRSLQLGAASLILVFGNTLSIRYRMDEKRFDVDGTYNARYEIIKKRIDKANIKGTEERITQKGKMVIIYSQDKNEKEYLKYVRYLQDKNYFDKEVELLQLEDVQGVVGLKAIRVAIKYEKGIQIEGRPSHKKGKKVSVPEDDA